MYGESNLLKLQVEIECILCNKAVNSWFIILRVSHIQLYAKCPNCGVMNRTTMPNTITLARMPDYLRDKAALKSRMDNGEMQRLERTRERYKIPSHIPLQQIYKYARIKSDEKQKEIKARRSTYGDE